jgi:hypothetical protein
VGSRATFRKGDTELKDGSGEYGIQTKITYSIWKSGEVPNVRWTYFTLQLLRIASDCRKVRNYNADLAESH